VTCRLARPERARRCARKLAEYGYRKNRESRTADITVTWLMRALGKSRRTVQRYLRQLERAGYIAVEVIHARTRDNQTTPTSPRGTVA